MSLAFLCPGCEVPTLVYPGLLIAWKWCSGCKRREEEALTGADRNPKVPMTFVAENFPMPDFVMHAKDCDAPWGFGCSCRARADVWGPR